MRLNSFFFFLHEQSKFIAFDDMRTLLNLVKVGSVFEIFLVNAKLAAPHIFQGHL